jgi:hypothetical protein
MTGGYEWNEYRLPTVWTGTLQPRGSKLPDKETENQSEERRMFDHIQLEVNRVVQDESRARFAPMPRDTDPCAMLGPDPARNNFADHRDSIGHPIWRKGFCEGRTRSRSSPGRARTASAFIGMTSHQVVNEYR